MKLKMLSMAVMLVSGLAFAGNAEAARADRRQVVQQERIVQGVRSGQLTRREAKRLEAQHAKIRADIRKARRDDGRLDAQERAKIEREQDQLSRRIEHQKHDAQTR
ncbi:MAG: hypothetical protein IRZ16_06215 [Myxococcaceae bacterium]|nr:hypothetical protein [Myxococcaceae bacterium]